MAMPWAMTLWMAKMVWLALTGWVSSCLIVLMRSPALSEPAILVLSMLADWIVEFDTIWRSRAQTLPRKACWGD
ncbi:hypothetical protein I3760_09G045500 [Carya illinoinensis]|nr:hypothetical protein I3760_09G045500 [Carya illinoinensis]